MVNCIYHHLSNLDAAKQSATGSPFAGYNFQNWKWKSERSKNLHGKDEPKEERWRNLFVGLVWGLEKKSWVECLTYWNSQCQWIHCSRPVALISQGYIFCDILQISVILVYYDILWYIIFINCIWLSQKWSQKLHVAPSVSLPCALRADRSLESNKTNRKCSIGAKLVLLPRRTE